MRTKTELAARIFQRAYLTGAFRLRSGGESREYFDKYRFEADPMLLQSVATHLRPLIPPNTEMLAGLEMGGIPIATMLSHVTGFPALFVRKTAKPYGTCRYAEGGDIGGRRLLIVEDVITSGGQVIESVRALRRDGAVISDVVCVIDREAGGAPNLEREGLALHRLFTMAELKAAPDSGVHA